MNATHKVHHATRETASPLPHAWRDELQRRVASAGLRATARNLGLHPTTLRRAARGVALGALTVRAVAAALAAAPPGRAA